MGKQKPRVINSLYDIEAGDNVYFTSRYQEGILEVTHTTATQIVCGAQRFRRSDGYEIPVKAWNLNCIQILTEERRRQYEDRKKRKSLISTISHTDWSRLTTAGLEKIHIIITDEFLDTI